jgi:hypothetical protein
MTANRPHTEILTVPQQTARIELAQQFSEQLLDQPVLRQPLTEPPDCAVVRRLVIK